MGIFSKLLRSGVTSSGSLTADNDFWYGITGGPTNAGVPVNEKTALKYLTVFACVSLISGYIARLPLIMYRKNKDGGKTRILDHPLADVLHNAPNANTTSFQFREAAQSHLLLWGNTYSVKKREAYGGRVIGLNQISEPGGVALKKDRRGYYYEWYEKEKGLIRKPKKDIFHIPGFGFNGMVGMSMISLAKEAIGLGLAAEEFGELYFGQGTHPAGTIETDVDLGDGRKAYIDALKKGYAGLGKSHNIMLLERGAKYKPLTMPLNDAQFLETRTFQKIEVCAMYHVPPHKIAIHGHNSDNNSLEQENALFVDSGLMPWLVRWEQNIALQLLTKEERMQGYFVEFLVEGLLRGDSQARSEYYNKMFQVGALSPNKILAKENMNPIEGGDQHFVQLNMIPLDMAGEIAKDNSQTNEPEPKKIEDKTLRENRSQNSIIVRDRIAKQYYPLFHRAAQDIVNKEGLAVKKQINKQRKSRSDAKMQSWLNDFYRKLPDYIRTKLGPVIRSFSEAIQAASAAEMGVDVEITEEMEKFINDYSERYSERHIESSLGQLTSLLEDNLDALEARVDEWEEKRADKIALNETVRGSSAVYQAVAFGIGLSTVWRIRGAQTCPYCKSLNGKRVVRGQTFASPGDVIDPKSGTGPMKINGTKQHPPLHAGCDCYIGI